MINRIPLIGAETRYYDIIEGWKAISNKTYKSAFEIDISKYLLLKHVLLLNSGLSSYFIALKAIKRCSSKKEVICPAYTAPALILPVLRSGLKPVLCDISIDDFNIDTLGLYNRVSSDTLCVLPVHMFGIPVKDIAEYRSSIKKDVFIIEDCAQAMGSKVSGSSVGTFSDISFFSFNRGKNISTYGGGAIATDSDRLNKIMEDEMALLKERSIFYNMALSMEYLAFTLAITPYIYKFIYPLASFFKDNRVPDKFCAARFSDFQYGLGRSIFKRLDSISEKRYHNGMALINSLASLDKIILPKVEALSRPAFNRLPVLFKDLSLKEKIVKSLLGKGIETSSMYLRPIHHIFDLGYKKQDFPNAIYLSERLLTLPTHSLVDKRTLTVIIEVFRKIHG